MAKYFVTAGSGVSEWLCSSFLWVIGLLALFPTSPAQTQESTVFSYRARLSERDHKRVSDGASLSTIPGIKAQDILLQDRLNIHRYGLYDSEDHRDAGYEALGREAYIALFENLPLRSDPPAGEVDIIYGTPLVEVAVRSNEIVVKVLQSGAGSLQPFKEQQPPSSRSLAPAGSTGQVPTMPSLPKGAGHADPPLREPDDTLDFDLNRLLLGLLLVVVSSVVGYVLIPRLVEDGPAHAHFLNSRYIRATVFFIVAIIILVRAEAVLAWLHINNYPWFTPLILALISAGVIAFFPQGSLYSLVAWPIGVLLLVWSIQYLLVLLVFTLVAIGIISTPLVLYFISIYWPVLYINEVYGKTAVSIYAIAWITVFFLTFRSTWRKSFSGGAKALALGQVLSGWMSRKFSPYPIARLLARIAHGLGKFLGSDVFVGNRS